MSTDYEDTKIIDEYLLFHYGTSSEILSDEVSWPAGMEAALEFPKRTVSHFTGEMVGSALDLGCAVGRSTFEMARNSQSVLGLDFSHGFIEAAEKLRAGEQPPYRRLEGAHQFTDLVAKLPEGIDPARVSFQQGDAMNLPENIGSFDRVHAANLICRLSEPMRLLERFPSLVKSGGELVIATPCTWLGEFTPPENWPEGDTADWLEKHLGADFEFVRKADEPFLIRETSRKFQWTRSLVTVWKRR